MPRFNVGDIVIYVNSNENLRFNFNNLLIKIQNEVISMYFEAKDKKMRESVDCEDWAPVKIIPNSHQNMVNFIAKFNLSELFKNLNEEEDLGVSIFRIFKENEKFEEINQNKNDSVIKSDAYILQSPLIKDSVIDDFYEVKRFTIEPGDYDLRIELTDLNNPKSKTGGKQKIKIDNFKISPSISDIEVAEYAYESDLENNFVKSGFHIIPLISNFYPTDLTKIPAYFEVYNSDKIGDSIVGIIQKIVRK
jgi:hypothetical protein